jgi:hypothetical protein
MAGFPQEAAMIERAIFTHYRTIRSAITTILTFGIALLLGQMILWARL